MVTGDVPPDSGQAIVVDIADDGRILQLPLNVQLPIAGLFACELYISHNSDILSQNPSPIGSYSYLRHGLTTFLSPFDLDAAMVEDTTIPLYLNPAQLKHFIVTTDEQRPSETRLPFSAIVEVVVSGHFSPQGSRILLRSELLLVLRQDGFGRARRDPAVVLRMIESHPGFGLPVSLHTHIGAPDYDVTAAYYGEPAGSPAAAPQIAPRPVERAAMTTRPRRRVAYASLASAITIASVVGTSFLLDTSSPPKRLSAEATLPEASAQREGGAAPAKGPPPASAQMMPTQRKWWSLGFGLRRSKSLPMMPPPRSGNPHHSPFRTEPGDSHGDFAEPAAPFASPNSSPDPWFPWPPLTSPVTPHLLSPDSPRLPTPHDFFRNPGDVLQQMLEAPTVPRDPLPPPSHSQLQPNVPLEINAALALLLATQPRTRSAVESIVSLGIYAPRYCSAGEDFLVQALLCPPDIAARVGGRRARAADPATALRGAVVLNAPFEEGEQMTVELEAPGHRLDEPRQQLVWTGEPMLCQFVVDVRSGSRGAVQCIARVLRGDVPVGCLKFRVPVSSSEALSRTPEPVGNEARVYRHAFLSYASQDRSEVLKRAQVLSAARIPYFQDLLSLEPGERWESRLFHEIDQCDLFLLFWSSHARASEWVGRETERALKRQRREGAPDIIPILLEGPPPPEPPPSMQDIHFDDRLTYLISASSSLGSRRQPNG